MKLLTISGPTAAQLSENKNKHLEQENDKSFLCLELRNKNNFLRAE